MTPSGNSVIGISIGASNPDQQNDVSITLSVNGANMDVYQLTVREPSWISLKSDDTSFGGGGPILWGYTTAYKYDVFDQYDDKLPYDYAFNENLSTTIPDYTSENWDANAPAANGAMVDHTLGVEDDFQISGSYLNGVYPIGVSGSTVPVYHRNHQIYCVGSTTPNKKRGVQVDDSTLQWYLGFAQRQEN